MGRFWLFAVLLLFPACKMADTGTGSVQGHVTQYGTSLPMPEVEVMYGDSTVLTDENGEYLFEGIPENLQGLRFSSDGYFPLFTQVNVLRNKTVSCDVELELMTSAWAVGKIDSEYGVILHSSDGGNTWIRQGSQSVIPSVNLNDVCAVDGDVCWVAGDSDSFGNTCVILKTVDGGLTWENQGRSITSVPPVSFSAIFAKDSDTAWAVAADTCLVFKTVNGGSNWDICRESEMMECYTAISSPDGLHVWCCGKSVAGGAAVEFTSDGGRSWTVAMIPGTSHLQVAADIYASDLSDIYVCGTNAMGAFRSVDGGNTWTVLENMLSGVSLRAIDGFRYSNFWVLQDGGSVFKTSDSFGSVSNVFAVDQTYADGTAASIDFMRDGKGGALAVLSASGSTGAIYYTVDGGNTWTLATVPFQFAINAIDFIGGSN